MENVAVVKNPEERLWRTGHKSGSRAMYALISNDEAKPSEYDPLVGSMESAELAEIVVDVHNAAVRMFGRHVRMFGQKNNV